MYGELGAVKGIVDLSSGHALDEADAFLASQGYSILRRTSTTLTVERRSPDQAVGEAVPNLTVVAMPQPEGGVQIKIRGNDVEGVQARQSEWIGWSEGLPRKVHETAAVSTPEADVPVPPPPQQEEAGAQPLEQAEAQPREPWTTGRLALGCLGVFFVVFVVGAGLAALGGNGGGNEDPEARQIRGS
jgi:hypothetical protein